MANSTKYLLAEQVQTRLAGGLGASQPVQNGDIVKAIEQIINSMFQMQYYNATYSGQQKVNQAILFPTRLTNAELASLTTI